MAAIVVGTVANVTGDYSRTSSVTAFPSSAPAVVLAFS
jgi:hypothetical protein